ncbi:MAG: hypothetical protein HC837_15980 [Chloroflexaceae bacterium]|nr:hypothetical protein [Chloroflexaceae bacterium]
MVTIELSGLTLIIILMALGGWYGWWRGMRSFLTVTLASVIGYLLFVGGAEQLLGFVNNLYVNLPKLFAIFTGTNPDTVTQFDPIFAGQNPLPLSVRVVMFIVVVVLGRVFNKQPWHSDNPKSVTERQLGIFTGAMTALLWTSAATTFWQQFVAENGAQSGLIADVFNILPDAGSVLPWLILIFLAIVGLGLLRNLPRILKA